MGWDVFGEMIELLWQSEVIPYVSTFRSRLNWRTGGSSVRELVAYVESQLPEVSQKYKAQAPSRRGSSRCASAVAVLAGAGWLLQWEGARRWLGAGLRWAGFGLLGAVLAATLVHGHGLSTAWEDRVALLAGILGAAAGARWHRRLGPERFWPAFGRFGFALLGSLVLGILGILGPGEWGVALGVLAPLLVFAVLAARGRIVPPGPSRG